MPIRAVLLASAALLAQGATTLRWTPKEGDVVKIRTEATLTVAGTEATMTSLNTHKVIRVDPDGSFLVQATPSEGKVRFGGEERASGGLTILTTYASNGDIKEIRNERIDATTYRMANLCEFHPPTKAVSVGDSWTSEGKGDPKTGAPAWKADYKVVGQETLLGAYSCLKIELTKARETEGSDAGSVTGTFWIGEDGVFARSELVWTNVAVPGAPGPVNGKITRSRVP